VTYYEATIQLLPGGCVVKIMKVIEDTEYEGAQIFQDIHEAVEYVEDFLEAAEFQESKSTLSA